MINMSIINFIVILTNIGILCYYLGKGNIKFVKNVKMTDEQFQQIKEQEKRRIDLEMKIQEDINIIKNYQDPEFLN